MLHQDPKRRPVRSRRWPALALLATGLIIAFYLGRSTAPAPELGDDLSASDELATGDVLYWRAPMDANEIYDSPGKSKMGMDLIPVYGEEAQEAASGTVRIDPVALQNIGVRTVPVVVESLPREIRTTGRFVMDEQGERIVTMKVGGWIEKLYADFDGMRIGAGDPLLELFSPELVSTQEEYLLAFRNMVRLEGTEAAEDGQRLLDAARRRLAYWDISEGQISKLQETGEPQRTVLFRSPWSGEIMRKQVAEGEHVEAGQTLMDIVDISRNWLIVDVYERDLPWVRTGMPARIELPYDPGTIYGGRVEYLYHMLDATTRSAKARILMPGGHLAPIKPGMYATVYLTSSAAAPAPIVPEEALIRTGEEEWVILALGGGRFRPVRVQAGLASNDRVQILDGLQGGEQVVAGAQFLIDSEARLRGALGSMVATDTPQQTDSGEAMNMEMGTDPTSQTGADSMRSQR